MREFRDDRSVPLFVTLLVIAFVTMTMDVRTSGEGALDTVREGASRLLAPVQAVGSAVVDPISRLVENLSDIAGLRNENAALRAELARAQAELAAVEQVRARLEVLEEMLGLELSTEQLLRTNANVIGRSDSIDELLTIDRGEEAGILPGHPVLDQNGYVVGRILDSWQGGAQVVPLIRDVEGITVTVGDQFGSLQPVIGSTQMVLNVLESARPVEAGDQVVTSQLSIAFPRGLPVGEIVASARPQGQTLTAFVQPFPDTNRLEAVIVIAWPPDPAAAAADDTPENGAGAGTGGEG
ncbi:MAG TPA: rod shape-determining protein MreC [Acidimicrobiia bacterium]|nr:rod shape-determining protein MreC [Acidimicrobiia bacterium]